MKKLLTLFAVCAVALPMMAPRAEAQSAFMPYLGFDLDAQALFLGVGAEFGLPIATPIGLALRPSAEYLFSGEGSDVTRLQFNADVIGNLAGGGPGLGLFAGAGLGVRYFGGTDNVDSSTNLGLNVLAGAEFGAGFLTPFAQGRVHIGDGGTALAVMGGVKLGL
jgi:hypothetical protein